MLYRIHQRLLIKNEFIECGPGVVHSLWNLSQGKIDILVTVGAITPVQAPPMETFKGWTLRAERLGAVGIDTIGLLEMPSQDVADAITSKPHVVEKWQKELRILLGIGDRAKVSRQ